MKSVKEIDALLPQTQCGECGFSGCLPYAESLAQGLAPINKCPPGGVKTLKALGHALHQKAAPFISDMLQKTRQPTLAFIKEEECIGCTKCIKACPVDAIVGHAKSMHTVIAHECTGCGLCVAPCPVDCIAMIPVTQALYDKDTARARFTAKKVRALREEERRSKAKTANRPDPLPNDEAFDKSSKQQYIQEALARARAKRAL